MAIGTAHVLARGLTYISHREIYVTVDKVVPSV